MKITASFNSQGGALVNHEHNVKEEYREKLEHVNHELTKENVVVFDMFEGVENYKTEAIRERIKDNLGSQIVKIGDKEKTVFEILEEKNEEQKRKGHAERCKTIDDLMNKKLNVGGKEKRKVFEISEREAVFQFGNKETVSEANYFCLSNEQIDRGEAKDMLLKLADELKEEFKGRAVITQISIHVDEETPHMHIDYVPCLFKEKGKGLSISFSENDFAQSFLTKEQIEEIKTQEPNEKKANALMYRQYNYEIEKIFDRVAMNFGHEINNPHIEGQKHSSQNEWREMNKEIKNLNEEISHERNRFNVFEKIESKLEKIADSFHIAKDNAEQWISKTFDQILENYNKLLKRDQENRQKLYDLSKENEILKSQLVNQKELTNEMERMNDRIENFQNFAASIARCDEGLYSELEDKISDEDRETIEEAIEQQNDRIFDDYEREL